MIAGKLPGIKNLIIICLFLLAAGAGGGDAAATGNLDIYVENEAGGYQSGAVVVRYDSGWGPIDQKTTDTADKVSWTGISTGTYKYEVYYSGEFWGAGESIVSSKTTTIKYFRKYTPYILSVSIKDKSGNAKTTFVPGEKVHVDVTLKNPGTVSYTTESILRIAKGKTSPYVLDEMHGPVSISAGGYGYFGWDWSIPAAASGTYYVNPSAFTYINNKSILTDNAGWGWNFNVVKPQDSFKFRSRALYVWGEADTILENPAEADVLIRFAREHSINTLFFYTDQLKLSDSRQQFKSFIARAHSSNLYVHALNGDAAWITSRQAAANYINALVSYNVNAQSNEKFDGVHLDIEPYTLPSWEKDSNGDSMTLAQSSVNRNIATQYLQMLSGLKDTISESKERMTFGADIPFWFDGSGFELIYSGNNKLFSSHIQDTVDFVTIMDYTDNYSNAITWATNEINYGAAISKYVVLAFETQDVGNSGSSFYEEGASALENALQQVTNAFSAKPSFKGFAIHHYGSYRSLRG
ncbi:MAG: hypothetical protein OIN66_08100 [Candidatus Methanoperedens sp.]|nr:hypothetical protein [Candidatus Methanoperedens sp.]